MGTLLMGLVRIGGWLVTRVSSIKDFFFGLVRVQVILGFEK
jgi:hypothetical protein